ncbi:MAG: hypothetical protein O7C68_00315 [Rickettsia endosymbiont of Ixodes ricinus]|uniref:hypothetical protein n=1 Tax=Rickettsia helvetica TaxID=35789 RepID=UPI0002E45E3B|nr:hypothetical protein [Rickettsia helvetica]MCZ6884169.1 hypothetical protein [Rickettsia endosymbiont of Ixodes ricinus]MCZ6896140.1 hypothetical protein [Rickettsia endosymbiont of Ixodes ricinus]
MGNSRWINVADNNSKKGKHESKAEFDVLYQLLKSILNKPNSKELLEQIYVITMYKSFKLYIHKNIKY